MSYINAVKTKYGFEYRIGSLTIARGKWTTKNGEWVLRICHMGSEPDTYSHVADDGQTMPIKDVFPYLQSLMRDG